MANTTKKVPVQGSSDQDSVAQKLPVKKKKSTTRKSATKQSGKSVDSANSTKSAKPTKATKKSTPQKSSNNAAKQEAQNPKVEARVEAEPQSEVKVEAQSENQVAAELQPKSKSQPKTAKSIPINNIPRQAQTVDVKFSKKNVATKLQPQPSSQPDPQPQLRPPRTGRLKRAALRIFWRALILVAAAVLLTWFLQYRYFGNSADGVWQFLDNHPEIFWYSTLIMGSLLLFLMSIIKRPFVATGTLMSIIVILTFINIQKVAARGAPLLPEDFRLTTDIGAATNLVNTWQLVAMILSVVIIMRLSFLIDRLLRKYLQPSKDEVSKIWWRRLLGWTPRLGVALIALLLFGNLTNFVINHSGENYETIPWLNTELVAWNQTENYDRNGFLIGFLYNMKKFELQPPDGYNEETIGTIAGNYNKQSQADAAATPLESADYNIVVVLNESFYDPSIIADYYQYTGGDVTPVLHQIEQRYPSGYMYSPDYGGGTANIEFEVLTGLTNYWANTVPYTDLLPKLDSLPSIASYAKAAGYQTTAVHPYNGSMYKRNISLKVEGIDQFIDLGQIQHKEHDDNSPYVNDRSAYSEVLDLLKERSNKQFIHLITMQNHMPYDWENYEDHDFRVTSMAEWSVDRGAVETYLQSLHNSDAYLGEFIEALEKMDEKTVVLFYGDHSPGVFSEIHDNADKEIRDLSHLTPYFIYSNFDLPNTEVTEGPMDSTAKAAYTEMKLTCETRIYLTEALAEWCEKETPHALPTTTPNCLVNTLYNTLGVAKPTADYLLDSVCQQNPILAATYFGDSSPFMDTTMSSYQVLNYDLLGGEQWWLKFADRY